MRNDYPERRFSKIQVFFCYGRILVFHGYCVVLLTSIHAKHQFLIIHDLLTFIDFFLLVLQSPDASKYVSFH